MKTEIKAADTGPAPDIDANWLRMARINRRFPVLKHIRPLYLITLILIAWGIYILVVIQHAKSDGNCTCEEQIPVLIPEQLKESE